MAFKQTEWEFDNEEEKQTEFQLPPEGDRYLKIDAAAYDADARKYKIWFVDIGTDIPFTMIYNLDMAKNGKVIPNNISRNTLITLNRALFDSPKGIPNPVDIEGGVVSANISYREYNGKKYVNIREYLPPNEDMVVFSSIDQYYIGYEEGSGPEE